MKRTPAKSPRPDERLPTVATPNAVGVVGVGTEAPRGSPGADEVSYRVQHLQYLNCSDRPQGFYTDKDYGPVKPGFNFYRWMFQGSPLRLPIAETILVERDVVRVLREGPSGYLEREVVQFTQQTDRDEFVCRCLQSFVVDSRPLGQFPQSAMLQDRFVAVLKRPVSRPDAAVSNSCELLIPHYFQAQLVEALDSKSQTLVLQKLVKNRGSKPGVYRVFWRADTCAASPSGTVSGHFITNADYEFQAFEREHSGLPSAGVGYGGELVTGGAISSSKRAALSGLIEAINRSFMDEMRSKPDMSLSERAEATRIGQAAHRLCEKANLVSLSSGGGEGQGQGAGMPATHIPSSVVEGIATSRVLRKAMEEVRGYMESLVLWLQNTLGKQESLVYHVSDCVCDFIRDDAGKWWFVQLKGLDINAASVARCNTWFRYKQEGNVRALLHKRHQDRELARKKLEAERGLKCKTCGLNFQDGQTVDIEVREQQVLGGPSAKDVPRPKTAPQATTTTPSAAAAAAAAARTSNSLRVPPTHSTIQKRNVPAFGYELSRKMACRLSEIYRDNDFWLTKFSRAVLASKSSVPEARTVADKLARDENVLEMPPLACCFFCQQIVQEYSKAMGLCRDMSEKLRLANHRNLNAQQAAAQSPDQDCLAQAPDSPAASASASASATAGKRSPASGLLVRDTDGGFSLDPWRSQHFKRGTHLFRVLVMAHHLSAVKMPRAAAGPGASAALLGGVGVLSYSLGQVACRLPFKLALQGAEHEDDPLIPVRQSRIHYLCGTTADTRAFFAQKALSFSLSAAAPDLDVTGAGRGAAAAAGGAGGAGSNPLILQREERLCGFSVGLDKLHLKNSGALRDGSEKVDFLVPVSLGRGGSAVLRLSVAVVRDELLPWQINEVASLLREDGVFHPAPDFWEDSAGAMPDSWLEMMASSSGLETGDHDPSGGSPTTTSKRIPTGHPAEEAVFSQRLDAMADLLRTSQEVKANVPGIADSDDDDEDDDDDDHPQSSGNKATVGGGGGQGLLDRKRRSSEAGLSSVMAMARATFARMVESGEGVHLEAGEPGSQVGSAGGSSVRGKGNGKGDNDDDGDDDDGDDDEGEEDDKFGDEPEAKKKLTAAGADTREGGGRAVRGDASVSGGSSTSSGSEYDFDDKLKTYSFINALFVALRAEEVAAEVREGEDEDEDEDEGDKAASRAVSHKHRLTEGHILLRLALEQMLVEEHLPEALTWMDFQALINECIAWAKTQRSKIRIAKRDKKNEAQDSARMAKTKAATATAAAAAKADESAGATAGGGPPSLTPKAWIKAAELRLQDWRRDFSGSALDTHYCKSELILRERRGLLAGMPPSTKTTNYLLLPSSPWRKTRRFLFSLAVFEAASGGSPTLSLLALEQYASRERARLLRYISLCNEGEMAFPSFQKNYRTPETLGEPFSVARALLCCHLLSSSEQFRTLRDEDKAGDSLISAVGFVRAVEEAFFNVSNHLNKNELLSDQGIDAVIAELQLLATEHRMTLMNSESHAMQRRNTFSLGLSDGEAAAGDLATLVSRRRSSKLSEVTSAHKKGSDQNSPPVLFLTCDAHGVEKFFLADLCCVLCEREQLGGLGLGVGVGVGQGVAVTHATSLSPTAPPTPQDASKK